MQWRVATGTAGALEYLRRDMVVASEAVEFSFQDVRLLADKVTVDLAAKSLTAEGNVILDEGPRRLTGERLEYDLDTKTGTVFDGASLFSTDDFDLSYVVVPVDVVVGLGVPIVNPYLATGPEFRILASSGDAPEGLQDQLKNVGATWGLALGFEVGAPGG